MVLCEKGRIAGEQSSRNWGFVRQQGRDPAELPMMMESLRIWRQIGEETGEDVGFRQGGLLYLGDEPAHIARYEAWIDIAKQYQLDTRLLSATQVRKRLPGNTVNWLGGMHTPSDGQAEPRKATAAIARAAKRQGVNVLTDCAVRTVEASGGSVSHVVTERGAITTSTVVCAAGTWSGLLGRHLGIRLPQLKILGSVFRTSPFAGDLAPGFDDGGIWTPGVAIRRRQDGGYSVAHGAASVHDIVPETFRYFKWFQPAYRLERQKLRLRLSKRFITEWRTPSHWSKEAVSPFEMTRTLDPEPVHQVLAEARAYLIKCFPAFAHTTVLEQWAGFIDVTPDALPVISPVPTLPGFFFATGFSGHGFGIGPGAGKVVAEMVSGVPPTIDRTPFHFERFASGVRIERDL